MRRYENTSFYDLFKSLIQENVIDYKVHYKNDYEYHYIHSKGNDNYNDVFSQDELDIINKVVDFFKDYNTSDIVEYCHKEKGFIEAEYNNYISYDYALDIELG